MDCRVSLRQSGNDVGLTEVVAFEEQGFTRGFRQRIRKTIAKIQAGRMTAFAIVGKRFAREQGMFDSDWLD